MNKGENTMIKLLRFVSVWGSILMLIWLTIIIFDDPPRGLFVIFIAGLYVTLTSACLYGSAPTTIKYEDNFFSLWLRVRKAKLRKQIKELEE
jgi:hypothetical protein